MRTLNTIPIFLSLALAALILASCGGGGGGGGGGSGDPASDLAIMDVNVGDTSDVALNRIIVIEFNEDLDPDSVRPDTIQIRKGPDFGLQVPGEFRVDGNRVEFSPRLPVIGDISDSGLQPGTTYQVALPGVPAVATVRAFTGDRLGSRYETSFTTALADGSLFIDNFLDPGPPRVESVNPADGIVEVPAASELSLTFNRRPLDPATVTTENIFLTLVERDGTTFERLVEGGPILDQSRESVRIVWQPRFPLASRAIYRLTVRRHVADLIGADVVSFESVFSTRDEPLRDDDFVLEFTDTERTDLLDEDASTASWGEDVAGALAALFTAAGGDGTGGDLTPTEDIEFSASDFPRGVNTEVIDGVETDVFNFRRIEIPEGITVTIKPRASGPNRPVVIQALKDIRIDGILTVAGDRGEDGELTSNLRTIAAADGGIGGPGGADGADNYRGSSTRGHPPVNGANALLSGGGGAGGRASSSQTNYSYAGGGGGGGARERGQGGEKGGYPFTASRNGLGGLGGANAEDRGYFGNLERAPNTGGAGGGSGGLGYYFPSSRYKNGSGAGGGGGGAITVQTAGGIIIGVKGVVAAHGGVGGTTSAGSFYYGGAGGGGGGGSVRFRATRKITLAKDSEIDVAGGAGGKHIGTFTSYAGGRGGKGGDGWIRFEAGPIGENLPTPDIDGQPLAKLTYTPVSTGVFEPRGAGAPSVGQTRWVNLGVFDPVMQRPAAADKVAELNNDSMVIFVQMAVEHPRDLGEPDLSGLDLQDQDGDNATDDTLDPSTLSDWVPIEEIENLNGTGFQFLRLRVIFQLDENQGPDDLLPRLDRLRIPYKF